MSMSSSERPSEKYSWSFFSLMSRKGKTATDLSEIAVAAGAVRSATSATGVAGCSVARSFDSQNLSTTKYASAMQSTTMMARSRRCPVSFLIDRWGSTSTVGFSPSGVISYTQANNRTSGKPITMSITTNRLAQAGTSSMWKTTCTGSRMSQHATK